MLDKWIEKIRKCELLPELDLKHLCEYVQEIMLEESTVHPVSSPVTICGDIHGQFHDLLELFRTGGECPETSYIFMARSDPAQDAALLSLARPWRPIYLPARRDTQTAPPPTHPMPPPSPPPPFPAARRSHRAVLRRSRGTSSTVGTTASRR